MKIYMRYVVKFVMKHLLEIWNMIKKEELKKYMNISSYALLKN